MRRPSRDVTHPQAFVVPTLEGEVLVVLVGTTGRLTGRQIARLARRGSPAGIQQALNRLTVQGVVDVEHAGSSSLYSLNRDHLAAAAIEALARIREDLLTRLRAAIAACLDRAARS
jgi:DNA-binding transcriptional ArsR family regulator